MKRLFFITTAALFCVSFTMDTTVRKMKNFSFKTGERLEYKLHYGFINAGEGVIRVHPSTTPVSGKTCYKMDVSGKSVGTFALMMKVKDLWRSYVDTSTLYPVKAYRDINEAKYNLKETTFFRSSGKSVYVKASKKNRKDYKKQVYKTPKRSHDIVSSYYYLRNKDWASMKIGQKVDLSLFFEDTTYAFSVKYMGKDRVKVKAGRFKALKLKPIMPENSFFRGKEPVTFWLSDDKNHIPLRIEADIFVGSIQLDLKGYGGLRHKLNKY